ncbi:MAG: ABC transporter substrate-binding protein [Bacteroidales bacterium]|jgi:peptide/nickel transport system substrate-binding protein|nr:ABC transporter substrate-binding protein [Bacteroidales bacterium]
MVHFCKKNPFFLCLLLLYACNFGKNKETRTVFRYNESAGITSLDPAFAKDQANIWACNQLYNSLVQIDSDLNIEPCIAREWTISEDGKIYRFSLRNDVVFHQTDYFQFSTPVRKLTASDVVYSFNRLMSPQTASPGAWIFNMVDIDNQGNYAFFALNDSTVEIRLRSHFPPFLSLLSMQYCSIVPHEAIEKFGKDFRRYPVGTGCFQLKTWKEGVKMVMVKNPHYFEKDANGTTLPYLDAVSVSFIIDKQTAFMEFIKGNLDFLSGIDASYKDELLTKSGSLNPVYQSIIYMQSMPYLNTEYLGFYLTEEQNSNNPLLKKEVRQAINYGFDRQKMLRFIRNNIGTPGINGMLPLSLPPFENLSQSIGYTYDPQKAEQLLEKAGYPKGKNMPTIKLYATESYMDIIEYIAHQLQLLGMPIEIEKMQPAILRQFSSQGKIPFFRASWIADYPDGENYLSLFYSANKSPKGPNYTHYSNPEFDKLYLQSLAVIDNAQRLQLYHKMDSLIIADAPVVVLYYDRVLRFIQKNVSGMEINAMNLLILKKVKKEVK